MQVILWGGRAVCACGYILDYTINPVNILTFILHTFIRSFLNFRFCQIRPIFRILLFWFKLRYACKYVIMALKYQIIKREGFFSTPFSKKPQHEPSRKIESKLAAKLSSA